MGQQEDFFEMIKRERDNAPTGFKDGDTMYRLIKNAELIRSFGMSKREIAEAIGLPTAAGFVSIGLNAAEVMRHKGESIK